MVSNAKRPRSEKKHFVGDVSEIVSAEHQKCPTREKNNFVVCGSAEQKRHLSSERNEIVVRGSAEHNLSNEKWVVSINWSTGPRQHMSSEKRKFVASVNGMRSSKQTRLRRQKRAAGKDLLLTRSAGSS